MLNVISFLSWCILIIMILLVFANHKIAIIQNCNFYIQYNRKILIIKKRLVVMRSNFQLNKCSLVIKLSYVTETIK